MLKKVRWHRIGANLVLSTCALIVFLIIAEFVIRPVKGYPLLPIIPPSPYVDRGRLYQETTNRLYEPRPNVADRSTKPPMVINSYGMRDREYPLKKPPEVFRIAVLGDSFTFASSLPAEQVFDKRLEALLNAGGGPRRYEALNFGVIGYNSEQEMYMLEEKALAFQPDLVLVGFVLNDARPMENLAAGERIVPPRVREILRRSYLFLTIYESLGRIKRARAEPSLRSDISGLEKGDPDWERAQAALNRMKDTAEASGIKLVVAVFPLFNSPMADGYRYKAEHELVQAACDQIRITCLNLLPVYQGYSESQLSFIKGDIHPSALANQIAAQAIYDFLIGGRFVQQ